MIVSIADDGRIKLLESDDFKRFSVAVEAPGTAFDEIARNVLPTVTFEDMKVAWVDIATLKTLPDLASPESLAQFDAMVAKAAPHGWISADGRAIKSHVIWKA